MILSQPQESSTQNGIGNFFHSSYKVDQKKGIPVLVEKNSLSHILNKLEMVDIPGKPHVESYLRDQYRRNLRITTIRNSLLAIVSFLFLVKQNGKTHLEEIARGDLGAFIEHEQDRGLKPATVRNRLDNLKAFIRYLIRKEVVSAELLSKK